MGAVLFQWLVAEPTFQTTALGDTAGVRAWRARLAAILWISLALAVVSGAAWLLALAARIDGRGAPAGVVWVLLTQTWFGYLWTARAALAFLLFCALWLGKPRDGGTRSGRAFIAVTAICLMGSLAGSGHAAGTPGALGDVHLVADVLHLLAAAAWLGGLLPLSLLFGMALRQTDPSLASALPVATRRFSTLGFLSVGTLLATGLVNTCMLAGSLPALADTGYGRLLLLKVALFAVIVAIASINRLRLMPELPWTDAVRRLNRNARIEVALGLAIIAIVSVLGTLSPGAHLGTQMP
jgi:putative copper resistance protein D